MRQNEYLWSIMVKPVQFETPADISNVVQMMICVTDRVGKIVGKGENAGNKHFLGFTMFSKFCLPTFSFFPTMFSKSTLLIGL